MPEIQPITSRGCRDLAEMIAVWVKWIPGEWSLDVIRDGAHNAAILIPELGDRFAPTFHISSTEAGYVLVAHRWDFMEEVEVFHALASTLAYIESVAARGKIEGSASLH